ARGIVDRDVREDAALEATAVLERDEVVVHSRRGEIEPDAQLSAERAVQPVEATLVSLETTRRHDALLLEVVERRTVLRGLRSTRERDIVVLRVSGARDLLLPIRVRGAE